MREIIERLQYNHLLEEMATVGRFVVSRKGKPKSGEYKVFTTSDSGRPQVHVHIKSESGDVHACLKLDKPEYFSHGVAKDELNKEQLESFVEFLNSPSKQRVFTVGNTEYKLRTYWDYTVATWNEENPKCMMPVGIDSEGYIVTPDIPDYLSLNS